MPAYRKTVSVGTSWVPLTITTAAAERVMINTFHPGVVELVGMATATPPVDGPDDLAPVYLATTPGGLVGTVGSFFPDLAVTAIYARLQNFGTARVSIRHAP